MLNVRKKGLIILGVLVLGLIGNVGGVLGDREIHVEKDLGSGVNLYLNLKVYRPETHTEYNLRSPYTGWSTGWMRDYEEAKAKIRLYHELEGFYNCWYSQTREVTEEKLIEDFWKENDLLLSNYANWTAMTLSGRYNKLGMMDENGGSLTLDSYEQRATGDDSLIAIGNGTTSPTFSDYQLESETHRESIDTWTLDSSDSSFNITATTSFSFTDTYNISEVGWVINMYRVGGGSNTFCFMTRDTFSNITVNNGDTLTTNIIMQYGGGILDNYGQMIINALWDDYTNTVYPTCIDGDNYRIDQYWVADNENWYMYIGNGSTAVSLTDYTLDNKEMEDEINQDDQLLYERSGSDVNITVTGSFTLTSDYAIYEIALVTPLEIKAGSTNYNKLMITRYVLVSPWSVNSGDTISIDVKWIIDQP